MHVPFAALACAATLFSSSCLTSAADIPSDTPVSSLLSSAQAFLSKGQTSEALEYYDAAIARDPTNYLTFFKRATTYLSLGRTAQATQDFNKVLSLKPGFEGAHVQLGKIRARSADWDGAREQYLLAKKTPDSPELSTLVEAEGAAGLAEAAAASGNWDECIGQAGEAILTANRAVALRELRSRCRFEKGEVEEGMGDLHHVPQMKPGDTSPHVKISAISFFSLGDMDNGMAQIRKCLHSDPDSKVCKKLLNEEKYISKTLAKVTKAFDKNQPMTGVKLLIPGKEEPGLINEIKEQVTTFTEEGIIPRNAPSILLATVAELACQGYYDMNGKKAKEYCEESLALDGDSFYGLLYRAKALLEAEEFDASIASLNKAAEARPDKQNIVNPLLQKAQVALKRSKTKDYYKVLGVAHDADDRQIKSAYRRLSKQHHPDKAVKQGLTKEDAEKKMAALNEAYEVLSDPELRARFDRGDDPNSHEQQNPFQQGSPFGHGSPFMFQQGGPGGGQQKFQFQWGGGGGGFPFGH